MGSGMTSLVSVHKMPLGSSEAGATVAETGGAEARLLGNSEESEAADAKGAAHTECTTARSETRMVKNDRLDDMLCKELLSCILDVSSKSFYTFSALPADGMTVSEAIRSVMDVVVRSAHGELSHSAGLLSQTTSAITGKSAGAEDRKSASSMTKLGRGVYAAGCHPKGRSRGSVSSPADRPGRRL